MSSSTLASVHPAPSPGLSQHTPRFARTHYSPAKFIALSRYISTVSGWRVAAVLLLTPVPALLSSIAPALVPLCDPLLGHDANMTLNLHGALLVLLGSFGAIQLTLGATATPRHVYSELDTLIVALLTTPIVITCSYSISHFWRFPTPFSMLFCTVPWGVSLVLVHGVLYRKFQRHPTLLPSLARYAMPLSIQSSQFFVYAALTVLFDRVTTVYQIAMVIAFPLAKFILKRIMRRYTAALDEMSSEVAVSSVEICATLYQSMIMQTTPSTLALGIIMAVDLVQAMVTIKFFVGRHLQTPRDQVLHRAAEILERQAEQIQGNSVDRSQLRTKLTESEAVVVREALELATAIDSVLLIEYFEVSVPVINTLFLLATYKTSSTQYSLRLYPFYNNRTLVMSSTESVVLYSLLQSLSLAVMHVVLRRRHGTSAIRHLAFILEYHARSIQGKLVMFIPLVFYFTLLHYGAYAEASASLPLERLAKPFRLDDSHSRCIL